MESPCLSSRGHKEPCLPLAPTVRLVSEELRPSERTRVLDDLGPRPDVVSDPAQQNRIEAREQLSLVALLRLDRVGHSAGQAARRRGRARKLIARSRGASAWPSTHDPTADSARG